MNKKTERFMKCHLVRLLLGYVLMVLPVEKPAAQGLIRNDYYSVQAAPGFKNAPAFLVEHRQSGLQRRIVPSFQLVYSRKKPEMVPASMDGQPGVVSWQTKKGPSTNINGLGSTQLIARAYEVKNNQLLFHFKKTAAASVSLVVKFLPGQQAPVFELSLHARRPGNYSLGFTGMPEVDSSDIDFVYQPLTWSWKRFPSQFALTEEAFANTAAVFTNHHGYTEGLAVWPGSIPYRYARAAQWNKAGDPDDAFWKVFPADGPDGNSLFGMAVRNKAGKAQPMIYAPLPGTDTASMKAGGQYSISLVYVLQPGTWQKGVGFLLSRVFGYRSERQNARVSLNGTFENMLDFALNDVYSGWNETLKASNYQFDVPGTVKNVSALHALSLAMVTGNEEILRRRALPMIEYVMSREKFLYSTSDSANQSQAPSHLLKGPCVDIGELAGLNELTGGLTPAFATEADRLFGVTRKLNMNTETGGGTWQDYLARYRLGRGAGDLKKAVSGADDYLEEVYDHYSRTFFDSPGLRDKGAGFTTDYGYRIYDLYELFTETGNRRFLDAAETGARQLLLWTRSNPAPPAGTIVVNKGSRVEGIFPGRRQSAIAGAPFVPMDETTTVPEQEIPAWYTSLDGLIPEAPNTYAFGPVMLAHHAAWLLRLAHYTGDTLLRNAAYNAVLGRYANFPGYYFNSLHTDVYQRFDYPLHPFEDVKYNAIFYNHVWPHLALLMDFLVSDFYYRSNGQVDFPGTYAPGYAFLTSQVYGAKKGTMMGHKNIRLWMPSHAVRTGGIAFNHIMGYDKHDLYIAFANTAPDAVTEHILLNRDVIPWDQDREYHVIIYDTSGRREEGIMKNGSLQLAIEAGGLRCIRIEGLGPGRRTAAAGERDKAVHTPANRFLRYTAPGEAAKITAMVIQPNEQMAVFYAFSDQTEKQWRQCDFRYRINSGEWKLVSDQSYPYEFDIRLGDPGDRVTLEISAITVSGATIHFQQKLFNNKVDQ